jgi:hypothetical protein
MTTPQNLDFIKASRAEQIVNFRWKIIERLDSIHPNLLDYLQTAVIGTIIIGLWLYGLSIVELRQMADYGLLSILPIHFYLALLILIGNFCHLLHKHANQEALLLGHILLLIVMLHGSPPIIYEGVLRYSWAWKHIGVIDYIMRYETVNPTIQYLDAYHNWPGFFTLTAFMTEAAGLPSPIPISPWAQLFFNSLNLGAILLMFRAFTDDRRLIWLSVLFFFLINWVGQDYFAPQAFGYLLHLVILGCSLYWLKKKRYTNADLVKKWLKKEWLIKVYRSFFHSRSDDEMIERKTAVSQRVGITLVIVVLMAAVASNHQLTPFMTILGLGALVLFQRTQTTSLVVIQFMFTLIWVVFVASPFTEQNVQSLVSDFGDVFENADQTLISLGEASRDQANIATIGRILTLGSILMAGLGGLRRLLNGYRDIPVVLLIIAPFLMLAGNSYGGEMLFRVFLFIVPFIAFFSATLFYPTPFSGFKAKTAVSIFGVSLLFLAAFLFAYLGKERQYHFSKYEVEASQFLYETAPHGSILIEGSKNYPGQFKYYEKFFYVPLSREQWEEQIEFIEDPETTFHRWMSNESFTGAYLIITRSQKAEVEMIGAMPSGALDIVEEKLTNSPLFEVFYHNEDVSIFILADSIEGQ